MLSMLGALVSLPLSATYAFAMSGKASAASGDMSMSASADQMPCRKPAKSCAGCPQKFCPEMGSCLVKCFQPLPAPVSEARLLGDAISERVAPTLSPLIAGSLTPPLLRPPIV